MSVRTIGIRRSISRTVGVVSLAVRRRNAAIVFALSGIAYLLIYLYAIGNLSYSPGIGSDLLVVDQPFSRMFEPGPGPFAYEPIAIVDLWAVRYLLSPLNTAIGVGLAILVGINFGLTYLVIVQPKACGLGQGTGLLASIPAVISGGACCAPVLLIVLGITASGTLLAVITWLLPIGVLALFVSIVYLATQIDPVALSG